MHSLVWALQAIRFRLDRSGAELRSEALLPAAPGVKPEPTRPRRLVFDRPFLVYLKMRSGGRPFFAAWIDGPELLRPFGSSP